ncbi:MAG: hypothetical protein C0456_07350 [Hyphomonas sp.]|uniref:hypothetical protein n=1 Tax=Hyphomonas sp. TaxID=87 RepID=UPI001D3AFC9B|nr:hypothetical protein [Hyphomonas sp.]
MPLRQEIAGPEIATPWLMNLLPEGEPLRAMTRAFGLGAEDIAGRGGSGPSRGFARAEEKRKRPHGLKARRRERPPPAMRMYYRPATAPAARWCPMAARVHRSVH